MATDKTVKLRGMQAEEYPAYQSYFVHDYSIDLVKNHGLSAEVANQLATKSLAASFGDFGNDLESSEHQLLCIEITDSAKDSELTELVGYLWHKIDESAKSTYIYDFYIDEQCRSHGYGRQAMAQFEVMLAAQGVNQIKLRVAYQNPRALALYQEIGFEITGYNMAKSIS